ncbi:MAG: hypothetical protein QM608_08175, partial [Caulobacter sp.]
IRNAHRIHVIDGGQVVESGSHDDMVDEGGPYAQLLNLQRPSGAGESSIAGRGGQPPPYVN